MCILQQIQVYQSATIVLLVLSILVIIITFFGCCGAYKENRCLLATVCTYMTIRSFAKVVFMIIHQKWRRFIFFSYSTLDLTFCYWLAQELAPISFSREIWMLWKRHLLKHWKSMMICLKRLLTRLWWQLGIRFKLT